MSNMPDYIRQQLEQQRAPSIDAPQTGPDLRWAHRVVNLHKSGRRVSQTALQMARDALAGKGTQ